MGVDFSGKGGGFTFNWTGWENAFDAAKMYGWEPAGAVPSLIFCADTNEPYDGSRAAVVYFKPDMDCRERVGYFTNDHQFVTSEDAAQLAAALERALDDIPDHDAMRDKTREVGRGRHRACVLKQDVSFSPLELFSGELKDYLREFIAFCRTGGFFIG